MVAICCRKILYRYQYVFLFGLGVCFIFIMTSRHAKKILPDLDPYVLPDSSSFISPEDYKLHDTRKTCRLSELPHFANGTIDFDGFNNETGTPTGCFIVPNIVHLIKFNQETFEFHEVICMASILINQNPDYVFIHTNQHSFHGKYWDYIKKLPQSNKIVIKFLEQPKSVYNISMEAGWKNWHTSDLCRVRLLKKYGGMYFDNDVYVINNLNKYRVFEFTLEWNDKMFLGSQTLIANKDARVLDPWLETFREYNASRWYYNAGELPTTAVLVPSPWLIHRVKDMFGSAEAMLGYLYTKISDYRGPKPWHEYDAVHLFLRHQAFSFNESSVFQYHDARIKQMILKVMPSYMYPQYGESVTDVPPTTTTSTVTEKPTSLTTKKADRKEKPLTESPKKSSE